MSRSIGDRDFKGFTKRRLEQGTEGAAPLDVRYWGGRVCSIVVCVCVFFLLYLNGTLSPTITITITTHMYNNNHDDHDHDFAFSSFFVEDRLSCSELWKADLPLNRADIVHIRPVFFAPGGPVFIILFFSANTPAYLRITSTARTDEGLSKFGYCSKTQLFISSTSLWSVFYPGHCCCSDAGPFLLAARTLR